ncbi:MAG: hypothetical protein JWO75_3293, partial [Actinomycetia bacterium]|nr:hypothetical protein [Actinomycetes bacterium]
MQSIAVGRERVSGDHTVNSVTASATGFDLVAHHDLGGAGDGMQVIRQADAVYVGHAGTSGMGT